MAVVVATVLARAEARVLRTPAVSLSTLTWLATTGVVMVGNLRVVEDLIAAGHADTPTSLVPDIADHSLANAGAGGSSATGSPQVPPRPRYSSHRGSSQAPG
jgi:hypothetical protein